MGKKFKWRIDPNRIQQRILKLAGEVQDNLEDGEDFF
jgi:hypothetical protein